MSQPNPPFDSRLRDWPVPSSASPTLVGSTHSRSSSGSDPSNTATYTYNIERFDRQDNYNAATIYARIPANQSDPHPAARVRFYTTRAAVAIEAFDTAFGTSSLS